MYRRHDVSQFNNILRDCQQSSHMPRYRTSIPSVFVPSLFSAGETATRAFVKSCCPGGIG
jgi:hypothetical protein